MSFLQAPSPVPSPTATPACPTADETCRWLIDHTSNVWLATGGYYFFVKPLRILLILVIALIFRFLLHRLINRLVRTTGEGQVPAVLRPLREKLPSSLQEVAGIFPERRRQRAAAIGSVLGSTATAVVFSIAGLMILSELGLDLAPLLASAGIAGVALGFGAQSLVKDLIAGLFMLLEDQYGVGDVVDVGEASGTVEAVGLRITTIRDSRGVLWYIRNGEIVRVGNKSQGWSMTVVDIPVGFADIDRAMEVLRLAAGGMSDDPEWTDDLLEGPEVLGVEQITADSVLVRTQVKTNSDVQWRVGRELRRRLTEALGGAGVVTGPPAAGRVTVRPAGPGMSASDPPEERTVD
ncbi:MAG TPA: mechanosensitive ion channel family protein [Rugosimonospora sp.]|nr:mechanosensitive ion channel family protein [Rugosimonospora sp.]